MRTNRRHKAAEIIAALGAMFVLVLVILNLTSSEKKIKHVVDSRYGADDPQFVRAMGSLLGTPIVAGNRVTTLLNGDAIFPPMLEAIASARRSITFETYIYWSGSIGKRFSEALSERARAGVKVHLLLDWVGSGKMEKTWLDEMSRAGVEVERYHPVRWYTLSRFNNRTHRKLLVVDGRVGFTGGVGIADKWLGHAQDEDHWRETHYRLEGPAVAQMQAAFMDNWMKTRSVVLHGDAYFPDIPPAGEFRAQVVRSSPREGSESVRLMYLLAIAAARHSILIENSYFVPDDLAVDELIAARRRGVTIRLIVPGPKTDTEVTRKASRSRWGRLLEAGVEIAEYQPTMYHCKVFVVDGFFSSVGSTNFDNRSFRLNDEANLNVLSPEFAAEQARDFEADLARSRPVTLQDWKSRPILERLLEDTAGLLRSQL